MLLRRRVAAPLTALAEEALNESATPENCRGHCSSTFERILAEGAMTLPVTLSGGVLFAS